MNIEPCPLCKHTEITHHYEGYINEKDTHVECKVCGIAFMEYDELDKDKAIEMWNKNAIEIKCRADAAQHAEEMSGGTVKQTTVETTDTEILVEVECEGQWEHER